MGLILVLYLRNLLKLRPQKVLLVFLLILKLCVLCLGLCSIFS